MGAGVDLRLLGDGGGGPDRRHRNGGDWLAERQRLDLGLPVSMLITGGAFVLVLLLWRTRSQPARLEVVANG